MLCWQYCRYSFCIPSEKMSTEEYSGKSINCNILIVSILDILTLLSKWSKAFSD